MAETSYSLVYDRVKQINGNLSQNKDLLLLGKGQNRGECVSRSRDKDCVGDCVTLHQ